MSCVITDDQVLILIREYMQEALDRYVEAIHVATRIGGLANFNPIHNVYKTSLIETGSFLALIYGDDGLPGGVSQEPWQRIADSTVAAVFDGESSIPVERFGNQFFSIATTPLIISVPSAKFLRVTAAERVASVCLDQFAPRRVKRTYIRSREPTGINK